MGYSWALAAAMSAFSGFAAATIARRDAADERCSACGEPVKAGALSCRACGADVVF